jgi:hypothetical protein
MADKCTWTRRSRGKDYPCSKGPFREPADAYEPYSPYCREHYEMNQGYRQTYRAKLAVELAADPDALAEHRGANAERARRGSARNRELAHGALGDLQAMMDDERVDFRAKRTKGTYDDKEEAAGQREQVLRQQLRQRLQGRLLLVVIRALGPLGTEFDCNCNCTAGCCSARSKQPAPRGALACRVSGEERLLLAHTYQARAQHAHAHRYQVSDSYHFVPWNS